jgi:hypothetical protein
MHKEPRRVASSGVLLFRFCAGGLILRLTAILISVQPFAYDVRYNIYHNRDDEFNVVNHFFIHPLSLPE